jgi:hypothetical protein
MANLFVRKMKFFSIRAMGKNGMDVLLLTTYFFTFAVQITI